MSRVSILGAVVMLISWHNTARAQEPCVDLVLQTGHASRLSLIPPPDPDGDVPPRGALAILGSMRFRHGDAVSSLAVSTDGKKLVTVAAGRSSGVRVWNLPRGTTLQSFSRLHQDAAFFPDGRTLALLSTLEASVDLVDVESGQTLKRVPMPPGTERIAVAPDGKLFASIHFKEGKLIVLLFDAGTGKLVKQIERKVDEAAAGAKAGPAGELDAGSIRFLAFTGDGRTIAAAGWDKTVTLWEVASGESVREFGGLKNPATCFALSRDGKTLAAACSDGSLRGIDLAQGTEIFKIALGAQLVRSLDFSPDGKFLAVAGAVLEGDRWIEGDTVWDLTKGKRASQLPTMASCLTFAADGTLCVADTAAIRLFDPATGKEQHKPPSRVGHAGEIFGLVFAPDGKTLVSEGPDAMLWWNLKTGRQTLRAETQVGTQKSSLMFSPDGSKLVGSGGTVLDAGTAKVITKVPVQTNPFEGVASRQLELQVAFGEGGKTVIAADRDGIAVVWDALRAKGISNVTRRFKDGGETVGLSADGSLMVVSKQYFTAPFMGPHACGIWETATGKEVLSFELRNMEAPTKFVFSQDKKVLVAGISSGMICILDASTGQELRRIEANYKNLCLASLALSPDGTMVACWGVHNPFIRVWDVRTGAQLHYFPVIGHSDAGAKAGPVWSGLPPCWALAFSPDSAILAAGRADSTIVFWDVRKKAK